MRPVVRMLRKLANQVDNQGPRLMYLFDTTEQTLGYSAIRVTWHPRIGDKKNWIGTFWTQKAMRRTRDKFVNPAEITKLFSFVLSSLTMTY
jgi:hypothetical protein